MDTSKARLVAVLAAVVAVLAVIALVVTTYRGGTGRPSAGAPPTTNVTGEPEPAGPVGQPSATASPDPTPPEPTDDGGPDGTHVTISPAVKATVERVTLKFLDAWKGPGTPAERTKRLTPYATAFLASQLANVDPANLPTSHAVGRPAIATASEYAISTVTTFSDGLKVRCDLLFDATTWRVDNVLPVGTASPRASNPRASTPPARPAATKPPATTKPPAKQAGGP